MAHTLSKYNTIVVRAVVVGIISVTSMTKVLGYYNMVLEVTPNTFVRK